MRTHRLSAVLLCLAVLGAACTDGGGGADQVVTPPSPTASSEVDDAAPAADTSAPATPPASPSPEASPSPVEATAPATDAPRAVDVLAQREGTDLRFTHPWEPATSAADLAATIERTEAAARDASLPAEEREAAGFEAQFAYRQLAETPGWFEDVLAALPEDLHAMARGNVEAREALNRLLGERDEPPTTVPAWRIVPPAPADELVTYYREAAEQVGVEWEYLAAINLVETRMGRIRGFSTAGARGPMQFIPESWEIFGAGGDIDDERDSIFAAARHLKERDWDKGPRAALLRYNRSSNYADAVSAYAEVLQQDPDAYATYHGWQVLYSAGDDLFVFPVGYEEPEPVPLDEYREREVVEVAG